MASLRFRATVACGAHALLAPTLLAPVVLAAALLAGATAGCSDDVPALERLVQAQRLAAELLVQFTRAADASNRAVMADTDELSAACAREAEQATQQVQRDADALQAMLATGGYAEEAGMLEEFRGRYAEYRELDRTILELAVENTNLKAQRLSFGPGAEAAEAFRTALDAVVAATGPEDACRVQALAATAVSAVRGLQVVQAPHIAEADDAAMTAMEQRMAAFETSARDALRSLVDLAGVRTPAELAIATAALDRFVAVNAELVALSRRNTNVKSLELSLGRKRTVTAGCEESLRALRDALAQRGLGGTR